MPRRSPRSPPALPAITHTTRADQAEWQMDILERSGLDLRRALISHFNSVDVARLEQIARRNVFMGIDQIGFAKGPGYAALADLVAGACARGSEAAHPLIGHGAQDTPAPPWRHQLFHRVHAFSAAPARARRDRGADRHHAADNPARLLLGL